MPRFFGLTSSDKEIFLEPIFALMYYMGFTYNEAYALPIWQRLWFIKRINKEMKRSSEDGSTNSRALHDNSPGIRQMQNFGREAPPAKLRRFT